MIEIFFPYSDIRRRGRCGSFNWRLLNAVSNSAELVPKFGALPRLSSKKRLLVLRVIDVAPSPTPKTSQAISVQSK